MQHSAAQDILADQVTFWVFACARTDERLGPGNVQSSAISCSVSCMQYEIAVKISDFNT